jgi:hypothetical protein
MHYPEGQYSIYAGFPGLQYMYASQQPPNEYPPDRNSMSDGKTESKPRLSKDEVERLEKIFQDNPKPSSSVKAQLADELGLERPRINVTIYLTQPPMGNLLTHVFRTGFKTGEPRRSRKESRRNMKLAGQQRRLIPSPNHPQLLLVALRNYLIRKPTNK